MKRRDWETQHDRMSGRIDNDARVLDRIAKQYDDDINKVMDDVMERWGSKGAVKPVDLVKPLTVKQRASFVKDLDRLIASGKHSDDKQFTRKLERMRGRKTITRQHYIEMNLARVVSRIRMEQKGKLLKSLYQSWLDSERTVARLSNVGFTMSGDDFIFKRIGARFQGTSLLSRWYHQGSTMAEQFTFATSKALKKGVSAKGLKEVTKYFFSNGDYRAKRILITESARINSEAMMAGYKKANVKYFQYIAVMDSRTTDICIRKDLKVYRVDKMVVGKNAPPLHVNCRSSTKGYFVDDRTGQGSNYPNEVVK